MPRFTTPLRFNANEITHLKSTSKFSPRILEQKMHSGFCNSASVTSGNGLSVTELTARLDVDD
jgi:hypothetical protein